MRQDNTLNRIVAIADNGYPDAGKIGEYWDPDASEAQDSGEGDTLALFLARELMCCRGMRYEPGLREAIRLMEMAERDLESVRAALQNALDLQMATLPIKGLEEHGDG